MIAFSSHDSSGPGKAKRTDTDTWVPKNRCLLSGSKISIPSKSYRRKSPLPIPMASNTLPVLISSHSLSNQDSSQEESIISPSSFLPAHRASGLLSAWDTLSFLHHSFQDRQLGPSRACTRSLHKCPRGLNPASLQEGLHPPLKKGCFVIHLPKEVVFSLFAPRCWMY